MKKMVFYIIPLIMVLMGCASRGTAVAETNSNSPGMDLDSAIREAATQMGENLPGGTKVALVSVASSSAQLSEYVISRLEAALVSGKKLVVVDRANLDKVREEQGFQASGEVDDDSAKSIGKLLGAGAIVTGAFADLGDVYSLTLKAINIETATVAVSYPADVAKSTRIETLLASGGGAGSGYGNAAAAPAARRGSPGGSAAAPVQAQESVPTPVVKDAYEIGERGPAGGIVFYDKGVFESGWRYLEAAPRDLGPTEWGNAVVDETSTAIGSGQRNTQLILAIFTREGVTNSAAQFCAAFESGGYSGWFLPSRDELNLMYTNLRNQGLGIGFYWSSSQFQYHSTANMFAYGQDLSTGRQSDANNKSMSGKVRPVRQF
jgi:hypothetical protein